MGQPWGRCGADVGCPTCTQRLGCSRSPPNSWGPCRQKGCSVRATHMPTPYPQHPMDPHSPAPGWAAAGWAVLGRAQWAPAASRAPAWLGGRRGPRGSSSACAPWHAGPAGCVPTAAPRPQHLHQESGVTPCSVPLGPSPTVSQPHGAGTVGEGTQGGPQRVLGLWPELERREKRKRIWSVHTGCDQAVPPGMRGGVTQCPPAGHPPAGRGRAAPRRPAHCSSWGCSATGNQTQGRPVANRIPGRVTPPRGPSPSTLPVTQTQLPRDKGEDSGQSLARVAEVREEVHTHHGHCVLQPAGAVALVVVEPEGVAVPCCEPLHFHDHLLWPRGDLEPGHCTRGGSGHPAPGTPCLPPQHRARHPRGHPLPQHPQPSTPQQTPPPTLALGDSSLRHGPRTVCRDRESAGRGDGDTAAGQAGGSPGTTCH